MIYNGTPVGESEISDCFARFFDEKIKNIVNNVEISENVHNGTKKMTVGNSNFMTKNDIIECVKMLKVKNSEGYDHLVLIIIISY